MNNIVVISNIDAIASLLAGNVGKSLGYHLVKKITAKKDVAAGLKEVSDSGIGADTILISEGFDKEDHSITTWELILNIHNEYPDARIVYLAGDIDETDVASLRILGKLVKKGIYDIIVGSRMDEKTLIDALTNGKEYADVEKYALYDQASDEFDPRTGYEQVVLVSSMKPGSGKTFLATNLAVAIAKYGQLKRIDDQRMVPPRVAIVDGDLLNLSVGALLRVNNNNSNMATALSQVQQYVPASGRYELNDETLENLTKVIRRCLVPHKDIDNLYCMVAPNIDYDMLSSLSSAQFFFMMERLLKAFDVIICDSNSSFEHQTTSALFEMASRVYMLCDMDYNNICNNVRYNEKISKLGYGNKLHYILNKDIPYEVAHQCLYDMEYNGGEFQKNGILIDYRIPMVDNSKMKELDYNARILINDNDPTTELARCAVLEIANDIWKIDINRMKDEDDGSSNKVRKEFLAKLGKSITNTLNN